ncbi:MAG: hypothetical protein MUF71_16185 [Candidatus Kapabacteria bacterium]|nr:hypothetical protein [Candidatus Kapabacteria bacterium]
MLYSILALLYLGAILVMKTRVHHSIVTQLWGQRLIATSSALLMIGGTCTLLVVMLKGWTISVADVALCAFFVGMANIGWIAENDEEPFD